MSTPIYIHPCTTLIIQNLFDQENNGRGRPHFWLYPNFQHSLWTEKAAIPAKGLGKCTKSSWSLLLWPLHAVQVLWIAANPVADPVKSPCKITLPIKKLEHQNELRSSKRPQEWHPKGGTQQCSLVSGRKDLPGCLTHMRKPFVYAL